MKHLNKAEKDDTGIEIPEMFNEIKSTEHKERFLKNLDLVSKTEQTEEN